MRWIVALALVSLSGCMDPAALATGTECYEPLDDFAGGTPHLVLYWDLDGTPEVSGLRFDVNVLHGDKLVAQGQTTTDCIIFDMGDRRADGIELHAVDGDGRTYDVVGAIDFNGEFLMVEVPV